MRRLSLVLSILLCLCILVVPTSARAADDESYDTALITRTLSSWLGTQKNITLKNVSVGESIPFYALDEDGCTGSSRSCYHPVLHGDRAIGILGVHKAATTGYNYSLSTSWSAELDTMLSGGKDVVLIATEAGLFLCSDDDAVLVQASPESTEEQAEAVKADLLAMDRKKLDTFTLSDAAKWKPYSA